MLFVVALTLLARAAALTDSWTADGGSGFRTNAVELNYDVTVGQVHATYAFGEPEETAVSEVEEYFLQSPLVTSSRAGSGILLTTDSCRVVMLADPALSPPVAGGSARLWVPQSQWSPLSDPNVAPSMTAEACEIAGLVVDSSDVVYVLDRSNHALHALTAAPGMLSWLWSVQVNKTDPMYEYVDFDDDVSMVVLSAGKLWVPLMGSYFKSAGIALLVDTVDSPTTFSLVPRPTATCARETGPADHGSAAVTLKSNVQGVAQLSSTLCGRLLYGVDYGSPNATLVSASYPPNAGETLFEFEMGEHSHPLFDPITSNLFYVNFQTSPFAPLQKVCCLDTSSPTASEPCSSWPNVPQGCVSIPLLSAGDSGDKLAPLNFRCGSAARRRRPTLPPDPLTLCVPVPSLPDGRGSRSALTPSQATSTWPAAGRWTRTRWGARALTRCCSSTRPPRAPSWRSTARAATCTTRRRSS